MGPKPHTLSVALLPTTCLPSTGWLGVSRAVARSIRALPIKLEDNGPIDDGKPQQPDPAKSDAAEYAGLEVQDEYLVAKGTETAVLGCAFTSGTHMSHDQSSRQPHSGGLTFLLCRVKKKKKRNKLPKTKTCPKPHSRSENSSQSASLPAALTRPFVGIDRGEM